jgi:hypothetical protein
MNEDTAKGDSFENAQRPAKVLDPSVHVLVYTFESVDPFRKFDENVGLWQGKLGNFECEFIKHGTVRELIGAVATGPRNEQYGPSIAETPARPKLFLVAQPVSHYAAVIDSAAAFEPYLRCWEAFHQLQPNGFAIRFDLALGVLIDRAAPDPEASKWPEYPSIEGYGLVVAKIETEVPAPPPDWFTSVPGLVEQLLEQWRAAREGRANIADRAYWCLTKVKAAYGGERGAIQALNISRNVLEYLGRLTVPGRKVAAGRASTLTGEEHAWIVRAVPAVIRRVAERELGVSDLAELTMADI